LRYRIEGCLTLKDFENRWCNDKTNNGPKDAWRFKGIRVGIN